jgi:hypothetical protein
MNGLNLECSHNSSFRLIGLSASELAKAESIMGDCQYRTGSYFKDKAQKIITIPISQKTTAELLKSIIACASDYISYDFYVSTCNSNESFIIDVPEHVCSLIQKVGGGISFSYTYAGDENE